MSNVKNIRKIVFVVLGCFVTFIGIFAAMAFLIPEDMIQRYMLWGTWALGFGSFSTAMIAIIISLFAFFKTDKKDNETK